jgi:hypothetical protein
MQRRMNLACIRASLAIRMCFPSDSDCVVVDCLSSLRWLPESPNAKPMQGPPRAQVSSTLSSAQCRAPQPLSAEATWFKSSEKRIATACLLGGTGPTAGGGCISGAWPTYTLAAPALSVSVPTGRPPTHLLCAIPPEAPARGRCRCEGGSAVPQEPVARPETLGWVFARLGHHQPSCGRRAAPWRTATSHGSNTQQGTLAMRAPLRHSMHLQVGLHTAP